MGWSMWFGMGWSMWFGRGMGGKALLQVLPRILAIYKSRPADLGAPEPSPPQLATLLCAIDLINHI